MSQCPPWAVYYYHTCLPRLPAFILGTLERVDKPTYGRLMAHNKIMSHITCRKTRPRWKEIEVWRKVLGTVDHRQRTLVMPLGSRLVVHRG